MKTGEMLTACTRFYGPSGREEDAAKQFAEWFAPWVDEVTVDGMNNMIAHRKGTGPRIMLCAHLDEVALIVTAIEDDGSLRVGNIGGVDTRILPGHRVWVHGKETLFGTAGSMPPHLTGRSDRSAAWRREDIYVDVGYPAEKVRELVRIGDPVTFRREGTELMNGQWAGKTADDRACVVMMLLAAQRLKNMKCDADVYFVASSQEEVGGRGAATSAFALQPDVAVVMDVDFAPQPGVQDDNIPDLDSPSTSVGPWLQPVLTDRLMRCAKENGIKLQVNVLPRDTGTDADEISMTREGVPAVMVSLPEKYMHTSVETVDLHALEEGARLLALYLCDLSESWGEPLWT